MTKQEIVKQLERRLLENRRQLAKQRLNAGTRQRLSTEWVAIDVVIDDLKNDRPYSIQNGFISTHRGKVCLL